MNDLPPPDADRVLDLVAEALEQPSEARAAFLAAACGGDEALRAEAASLVGHDGQARGFLDGPAYEPESVGWLAGGNELADGDELGEYRVESLLGEGGMGEVYLAWDIRLERRVALKLLRRQFDDGTLLRRFRHERRVLAGLTHPNIARLYGGSLTPEGRAFLVMEYVEGERLDEYCRTRGLDLDARLLLFRKVCAAVAYAHQNLVVHRDLKPANVRVTPEGEPKLLDFGIAKLLEAEGATGGPAAVQTVTMSAAMTPEYASPEQFKGEPITTASDVYSLGVILYELLTGERPHPLKGRRPDELARAVCEEEAARPSTVAGRTATAAPGGEAARTGSEPPAKWRRRLQGDLDNIVAKAMRKDPARRYGSVGQLSEDIRRHGEGLPVTARPDTLPYRTGKFVRRNRLAVAAALLVLLALVGGLVATSLQRNRARLAQRQAERLNGFLQTLLGSNNPEAGRGRDLRVVQVLDDASRHLDAELADEPALRAQAHTTLGNAYKGLKEADPALRHLREAIKIDQALYGDGSLVTARAKAALGETIVDLQRNDEAAEPLLRQAIAVERRQPPAEQRELPELLRQLAAVLSTSSHYQEAAGLIEESLAYARRTGGENGLPYSDALQRLGVLQLNMDNYAAAEVSLRQAAALAKRLSPRGPSLGGKFYTLAYDLILENKLDEPEGLLQEAMECHRLTVGEESVDYYAALGALGWLHYLQGRYPQAESELRRALDYTRAYVPEGQQDLVGGHVLLGMTLTEEGRPAEAEPLLRRSLELARANDLIGLAAPDKVEACLGNCLLAQGRYPEAEGPLLDGYHGLQTRLGGQHPHTVEAARYLQKLYTAWNKPEQAARYVAGGTVPPAM